MTWAAAALVDPHPTNALSDVLKTLCGVEPTRNWSFVENIPPWGLNEVQTMTLSNWDAGDTFKLVFDGQTSAAISYASDMSAALTAALNAMDANNTSSITVGRTSATIYTFTAQSAYKYSNLDWDAAGITLGITEATGDTPPSASVARTTIGRNGTGAEAYSCDVFRCSGTGEDANDCGGDWYLAWWRRSTNTIYQVTISSGSAGDTWTLTCFGQTTAPIAWTGGDDSAAIQAALEDLAAFAPGDVSVSLYMPNIYLLEFMGAFTNTAVVLTGAGTGCSVTPTLYATGGNRSNVATWGVAELYSTKYKKFAQGVPYHAGNTSSSVLGTDATGYPSSGPARRWWPAVRFTDSGSGWAAVQQTLNTSGFNYWLKLTKNHLVMSTRVGTTERCGLGGLFDSIIDADMGETIPLFIHGYQCLACASNEAGGWSRLPGINGQAASYRTFGEVLVPWTYTGMVDTSNAGANYTDKWQEGRIYSYRVCLLHAVGTVIAAYGGLRGLWKPDLRVIKSGGTVNIGDTMVIDGNTWTAMGQVSNSSYSLLLFVEAE